jgi:peptide/nickel transport system substrate-binding protein
MNDEISGRLQMPEVTRRRMLKLGALGIGAFASVPLLAACGSSVSGGGAGK